MADEEKTKKASSPPRFKITNVVRRVNTRVRRAAAPGRRRFKQYVCGRRLLRKQSMTVSAEEMEQYQKRLYEQVREGAIKITAPNGTVLSADVLGNLIARNGRETQLVDKAKVPVYQEKAGAGELNEVPTQPEPKVEVSGPDEVELDEVEPDDLTELPGVGAGRARKLEAAGINTFKQVAEIDPSELVKLLGSPVTEDQAANICDAASEKEEG